MAALHRTSLWQFARTVVAMDPMGSAVAFGLLLITAFVEGASLLILIPLISLVGIDVGAGAPQGLSAFGRELIAAAGLPVTLPVVLGLFLALTFATAGLAYSLSIATSNLQHSVTHHLRTKLARELASMEYEGFSQLPPGRTVNALSGEVERVGTGTFSSLMAMVHGIVALVYLAWGISLAPGLTLLVAAAGGLLLVLARRGLRRSETFGDRYQQAVRSMTQAITEWTQGMKLVKATGRTGTEAIEESAGVAHASRISGARAHARSMRFTAALGATVLAGVVLLAVEGFRIAGGTLLLLIFVFARVVPRVTSAINSLHTLYAALPAFTSIQELSMEARALAEPAPEDWTPRLSRHLEADGITVRRGDVTVLEGATLSVNAGSIVAITGPSGAGKTTLIDTLAGLLAPVSGTLRIDGEPLTPARRAGWRAKVGYLPQEPVLFHSTIRANLLWAAPGATERDLREALALAGADFARGEGLDRDVGPRGVTLSGGERQRVALAMALVRKPLLLILDEPTSQLDAEREGIVLDTLRRLKGKLTMLVVTHEPGVLSVAETVLHVSDGRVRPAPRAQEASA